MRRVHASFALAALVGSSVAGPDPRVFDFTAGGNAQGQPIYETARGFGFEPGAPNRFSIRAAEGNHRITLRFIGSGLRVLAEQRRSLMDADSDSGSRNFIVNVRTPALPLLPANATGGSEVRLKPRELGSATWDDRLTLEILPDAQALQSISIEPADVPTLYLAGDSTVTDQAVAPNASWGQRLPRYFAPDIAVANHAESGETLKSFLSELRFDKLLSTLRAGDWVMIQFAHNDQKAQWPQTYVEAATTYRAYLRTYIAEIRRRGATAILVTSPERRNFDAGGRIVPSLGDYPLAMRAVANEESVALIDLEAMSRQFYETLGPSLAARAFADEGRDRTHFNEYGADALARMIVAGLRAADLELTAGLAAHLATGARDFNPAHPDPPPAAGPK